MGGLFPAWPCLSLSFSLSLAVAKIGACFYEGHRKRRHQVDVTRWTGAQCTWPGQESLILPETRTSCGK